VTTQLAGCPPVSLHSFTRLRHSRHGVSQPATVPAAGEGTGRGPLHPSYGIGGPAAPWGWRALAGVP